MSQVTNTSGIIAFLMVIFTLSHPVTAQDTTPSYKQFYVDGGGGAHGLQADLIRGTAIDFDETDLAYKVYGGRRFSRHFGIELSVVDYGEPSGSILDLGGHPGNQDANRNLWGTTFHAVGYIPHGTPQPDQDDFFELSWKTGPAWVSDSLDAHHRNAGSDLGASFGLGTRLHLSRQLAIRAEGETIQGFGSDSSSRILGFIGLEYHFD
jgi:hypothetical protein